MRTKLYFKRDKIILICDRVTEFSLYLVIFTSIFSKAAVESFFGLAFTAYFLKKALSFSANSRQPLFPSTKLDFPLLALVSANIISTMLSQNFIVSLKNFIAVFMENIIFYLMTLEVILFQKKGKNDFFILVIITASIALVIDAIFQLSFGKDIYRHFHMMAGQRLTASLGSPNTLAAWLILFTPLFCCWSIMVEIKNIIFRIGLIILSFLLILCIFLTYSRGAWLGFFVGALFIAAFKDKRMLTFFLILIIFFSAFSLLYPNSLTAVKSANAKQSVLIRFNIWREAIALIKDYPLCGVGLKNYLNMIPNYQIHCFNIPVNALDETTGISPHNGYLQMTAETGLIGLGCFLWILWTLFKNGIKSLNIKLDPVLLGLLSGLLAFLVSAFFDNHLGKVELSAVFWITLGLIVGLLKKQEQILGKEK